MGIKSKAGMQGKVRCYAPAANHRIHHRIHASAKHAAFSKGQVIQQVPIEQAGGIGDAASIISFCVVSILEEEPEAGLAGGPGKCFLVAERAKVAQAVAHTLGPRIVRAELQTLPRTLLHADLQSVIALNAAGIVKAYGW